MRRIIVAATLSLTILASCSPTTPAAADPATTTQAPAATSDPCRPGDRPCWEAHIQRQRNERLWWAEVARQQKARAEAARIARVYAFAYAVEQARLAQAARSDRYVQGIEVCNGRTLPTCEIVRQESGFNPNARNPRSSAWGLYQFLRGTWRGVCPEFPHGSATVAQQVECARRLWNGGRGSGHWRLTR